MSTITIGADPEFFVQRRRHVISGHIFPCGTKDKPLPLCNGSIQNDGVLVECNVTPALTETGFVANVQGVMGDLQKHLQDHDPEVKIVARPSFFFGQKKLLSLPENVSMLGCSSDYNAYTGMKNPSPDKNLPIRTGSGHIHVGWTKDENPRSRSHMEVCCRFAKQLDYYLGLPSLLWDEDHDRRRLYGSAGAFRPKPYGLEYRVLSNAWTKSPKLIGWVFRQTKRAIELALDDSLFENVYGTVPRGYINDGNPRWKTDYAALAESILK